MKVASVNTLNVPAKAKRMGAGRPGTTRAWKKAYVTLTADSKTIESSKAWSKEGVKQNVY